MSNDFTLKGYSYDLPQENIAQQPADKREDSRLLVLNTGAGAISHHQFKNIGDYIRDEDMLVVNDTRVFPARLHGRKTTGGRVEVFLLEFPAPEGPGRAAAPALIKSSKRPRQGAELVISEILTIKVGEQLAEGKIRIELVYDTSYELTDILNSCGQVPLPPYIERDGGTTSGDVERYQTVYADQPGAVAAPTAGLHFTDSLMESLTARGVTIGTVTLHVGYGTFAPVRTEKILEHTIHEEYVKIPQQTVEQINRVKKNGGRIWAVGTTSVRALEYAAQSGTLQPMEGWCDLYIYPGYTFRVIDNLITNFHLPESSLMFLVSALCGRTTLLECYNQAISKGYRFYSYGDAMAVIRQP